jgi:hypothetical protein
MQIGKIVKSNTQLDYVCQVDNPGEQSTCPSPQDYAFGTFVRLELVAAGDHLVGLVYNTMLMNPEFGSLGPRLSPAGDLEVFSPDYLREQATLVGIVAVGQVTQSGGVHQGVPRLAASVNAAVQTMSASEVHAFHHTPGGPALAYAPLLLAQGDCLMPHLLLHVVGQLEQLFAGYERQLSVLRGNLAWKATVAPAG